MRSSVLMVYINPFSKGEGKKSHPVSCKYCDAIAEGKAGVASALNACVVSLSQAVTAGYTAWGIPGTRAGA